MLGKTPERTGHSLEGSGWRSDVGWGLGSSLVAFPASAQTDVDLEFGDDETEEEAIAVETAYGVFSNGYLRIGIGSTNGGDFTIFKLNGAEFEVPPRQRKRRLRRVRPRLSRGACERIRFRRRGDGQWLRGFQRVHQWRRLRGDSNLVQAYAGIENIGNGAFREAFIWAGRRYYRRRDVHITDFYYENMSGDAVG